MIVINVKSPDSLNAGSKAPSDVNTILKEKFGAKVVTLILGENLIGKIRYKLKFFFTMLKARISKEVLVLQFPIIERNIILNLANKNKTIVLIHDIDGLRYQKDDFMKLEMSKLKLFKYMIVHNENMKKYLENQGIEAQLINLELFDYLCDGEVTAERKIFNKPEECELVYAGNLTKEKSPFIHQLDKEKMKFKFNVYGAGNGIEDLEGIVTYKGKVSPDELPNLLEGNLGLVWDGAYNEDDEKFCLKNYTKYNNPHKFSLYMASGLPAVVWKKAAVAKFVDKYDVGYTIDNIYDINNIDFSKYGEKLKNVSEIKEKVRSGYYIEKAVKECIEKMK